MSIELPRLPFFPRIAGGFQDFINTFLVWVDQLQIFFQKYGEAIEAQETTQDALLANLATTDATLTTAQAELLATQNQQAQLIVDLDAAVADIAAAQADADTANASAASLDTRTTALEGATGSYALKNQATGWTAPSGTLARATFAAYAGQTVSNPPTQAEVQAIDDHLKVISQTLAAALTDLIGPSDIFTA